MAASQSAPEARWCSHDPPHLKRPLSVNGQTHHCLTGGRTSMPRPTTGASARRAAARMEGGKAHRSTTGHRATRLPRMVLGREQGDGIGQPSRRQAAIQLCIGYTTLKRLFDARHNRRH